MLVLLEDEPTGALGREVPGEGPPDLRLHRASPYMRRVRCQVRGLVCLGEPRAATLLTLPPSAIAEASDSQGRSPLLVRAGSARHQEVLVPGGHERSPSAKADRRSK